MKKPKGRPSKYKPEYCEMLIKHMADGYSFESFAAIIDLDRDTIYEWTKAHPDFSDAKKRAVAKSQLFWEKIGHGGSLGRIKNFSAAAWIFSMKNRFQWRDKQPDEEDKTIVQPIIIEAPIAGKKIKVSK